MSRLGVSNYACFSGNSTPSVDWAPLLMVFHKMELPIPFLGIRARYRRGLFQVAGGQYDAALAIAQTADWRAPEEVKKSHPKAGRVVFNIKANDFRVVALVQYKESILMIRFFGSHEEYDDIDAETE
jgi:mRNA interferase HigB